MKPINVRFIKDSVKYETTIIWEELNHYDIKTDYQKITKLYECINIYVDGEEIDRCTDRWSDLNDMIVDWYEQNH